MTDRDIAIRQCSPQPVIAECEEDERPLVSVVIPFHSELHWLTEALSSVCKQDYRNIEVLLVDDGSGADLTEIVREQGTPIQVINKRNGGPASARNVGIDAATGKYIAFLDADDTWRPNKLSSQVDFMESTGIRWSQHSYRMFWEHSNKTTTVDTSKYSGDVLRDCFISFRIQTSCVMVLRDVLEEREIRFPAHKRYGEDGDFYSQLASIFPLGYVPGVFSDFRIRGSNAGLDARIQIRARASTWSDIRERPEILEILPKLVRCAYAICSHISGQIDRLSTHFPQVERLPEPVFRIAYVIPYLIFRLCGRR